MSGDDVEIEQVIHSPETGHWPLDIGRRQIGTKTATWKAIWQFGHCRQIIQIRGCSHIMSAKNRGSYTPPPPSVSNGQHLANYVTENEVGAY